MTKGNVTTIERHREQMDEVCAWSNRRDKVIEGLDAEIEHLGKCLEAKQKLRMAEKESEKATIMKEGAATRIFKGKVRNKA